MKYFLLSLLVALSFAFTPNAFAAEPSATVGGDSPFTNEEGFQLLPCDGSKEKPCDFNAAVMLVQRGINLLLYLGIMIGIFIIAKSGYMWITALNVGSPGDVAKAKEALRKVVVGFAIMLSAWLVVYEIIRFLTPDELEDTTLQLLQPKE